MADRFRTRFDADTADPMAVMGNLVDVMLVISAALLGGYMVLTRRLPRCHHPVVLLFQDGVFAGIDFSVAFIVSAQLMGDSSTTNRPDLETIVTAPAITALIGTISSLMMIGAARLTPAAKRAPVSYLEIASASCINVLVFAEMPTPGTILGMLTVVGVCLANVMTSWLSNA